MASKQTLCWVYLCPNVPTTTAQIRLACVGVKYVPVQVCEQHKHIRAWTTGSGTTPKRRR